MTVRSGDATANLAQQMLAKIKAGEDSAEKTAPKPDLALVDFVPRAPPGAKAPSAPPIPTAPRPTQQAAQSTKPQSTKPKATPPPGRSATAAAQATPSDAVTAAGDLIDEDAPWLPAEPDRKAAFLQVFRYWHGQVRPESAAKARPAFLFLVTALPMMVQSRNELQTLNLWEPPGEQSRQARDEHPAWRRYCEFLPRAQQALSELDNFKHLSLLSALDDLMDRVLKAEKRYREGLPKTGRR